MAIGKGNLIGLRLKREATLTEGKAGEIITPGMVVELQSDDTWDKASTANGPLQAVAKENDVVGPTDAQRGTKQIEINYAADDNILMIIPVKGDIVRLKHTDVTGLSIGDLLEIDGTDHGFVKILASGVAVAMAIETKIASTPGHFRCMIL